jgi:hypothetical protein
MPLVTDLLPCPPSPSVGRQAPTGEHGTHVVAPLGGFGDYANRAPDAVPSGKRCRWMGYR